MPATDASAAAAAEGERSEEEECGEARKEVG